MQDAAIILAAGHGTRLRSQMPKALHPLAGRPMLAHLVTTCEAAGFGRVLPVIPPDAPELAEVVAPHAAVTQRDRLGTAHAALQAMSAIGDGVGLCVVLYADNPLIRPETLQRLRAIHPPEGLAILAMRPADPGAYGRIVVDQNDFVERIVEFADATADQRKITLCNVGAFLARSSDMNRWLQAVQNSNAQGEYYLTDIVQIARSEGRIVRYVEAPEEECLGINSRHELARAESVLQNRLRAAAMAAGVTLIAPETVFLSCDTKLDPDVTVHPHVVFGPAVAVASGAQIRSFSHLEGCIIEREAIVGPFARIRPGTIVRASAHVGNFVELKNVSLGPGAKVNHLTYLGDATVGARTNVGAGTITCNYDGFLKHRTEIGDDAFIGSNVALVAPITVGAGAIIGAGSTVARDIPDGAIAVARGEQVVKESAAERFRERRRRARLAQPGLPRGKEGS